jgi:hypothetical protein
MQERHLDELGRLEGFGITNEIDPEKSEALEFGFSVEQEEHRICVWEEARESTSKMRFRGTEKV